MILECQLEWRYYDTPSNLIMPWYTLPTLQWLKSIDISNWKVFEYGAGYSTIWWRLHAKEIISIDNSRDWALAIGAIHEEEKNEYITEMSLCGQFDCVIVDGAWREDCARFAKDYIKSGGYMIIDNFGQEDFPQDYCDRISEDLKEWTREVYKQENHSQWVTAVFKKP